MNAMADHAGVVSATNGELIHPVETDFNAENNENNENNALTDDTTDDLGLSGPGGEDRTSPQLDQPVRSTPHALDARSIYSPASHSPFDVAASEQGRMFERLQQARQAQFIIHAEAQRQGLIAQSSAHRFPHTPAPPPTILTPFSTARTTTDRLHSSMAESTSSQRAAAAHLIAAHPQATQRTRERLNRAISSLGQIVDELQSAPSVAVPAAIPSLSSFEPTRLAVPTPRNPRPRVRVRVDDHALPSRRSAELLDCMLMVLVPIADGTQKPSARELILMLENLDTNEKCRFWFWLRDRGYDTEIKLVPVRHNGPIRLEFRIVEGGVTYTGY